MFDYFDPKIIGDNMRILFKWFAKMDSYDEKTGNIVALNFVLYNDKYNICDGMRPYEFFLYGSKSFSNKNDDWALNEDFIPSQFSVSPTLWLPKEYNAGYALAYMRTLLYHAIAKMRHLNLLDAYYITVGYESGELMRIRDVGHNAMAEIRSVLFDFNL